MATRCWARATTAVLACAPTAPAACGSLQEVVTVARTGSRSSACATVDTEVGASFAVPLSYPDVSFSHESVFHKGAKNNQMCNKSQRRCEFVALSRMCLSEITRF